MKKRILFVDDEPLILQGLQRLLRPMRHEWEMDFAEGGAKAMECGSAVAYDVVVSDMMMPGIDGAQLLKEFQRNSPQTIRLILSGKLEQQYAMKCVGVAHQYLSKPCEPEALKNTLSRVTSLDYVAHNERILKLLPRLERLPSIPALYSEIVQLLNDPEVCMENVGAVIGRDMAITAQILKVVNSSFFGLPRHISDPVEATSYLGVDTVKALVLATNVFSQFEGGTSNTFSVEALAKHSQQVGAAARAIALAERAPRLVVSECLVGGFLHDAGKLVLVANLPDEFQQAAALVAEQDLHPLDAEREVFGATHAEIGGYLLGLWGLPSAVVEAISLHHTPQNCQTHNFSALTAVHVANALVWERTPAACDSQKTAVNIEYLSALGLSERLPDWSCVVDETFSSDSD